MEEDSYIKLWKDISVQRNPLAFNQLFDQLLPVVMGMLEKKFNMASLSDREDSTVEAFLFLLMNPERFNPARAKMVTFLYTIAKNKLIDKLRASQRHRPISEMLLVSDASEVESQAIAHILFAGRDERSELRPELQEWLEKTLPSPQDQALFLLSMEERLTVDAFVELYEVHSLTVEEQRREMKRHRDRIKKRVTRDSATLLKLLTDPMDRKGITTDGK